jgi:hypothetical protein
MRDYQVKINPALVSDIKLPEFYDTIATLLGYQITQGQTFDDLTQYSNED